MKYTEYMNENAFTSTQGKLFVEEGDESAEWKLAIDISKIYSTRESISLADFNKKLSEYIFSKKDIIIKYAGEKFYYELTPVMEELKQLMDEEKSEKTYNKIYDLCDEYSVLLKTEKNQ